MSVGTTSPASARKSTARYARNPANHAKIKAKGKVQNAVKSGKLKKPKACPRCGRSGVRILFHHTNGYKAGNELKGRWLCDRCHGSVDNKRHGDSMRDSMRHKKSNT